MLSELLLAFLFERPLIIFSKWLCPYVEMAGNMCTLQVLNLTFLNFHPSLTCAFGKSLKKRRKKKQHWHFVSRTSCTYCYSNLVKHCNISDCISLSPGMHQWMLHSPEHDAHVLGEVKHHSLSVLSCVRPQTKEFLHSISSTPNAATT